MYVDLRQRLDDADVTALVNAGADSVPAGARLREAVRSDGAQLLGWLDGERLVGFVVVERDGGMLKLRRIGVVESERGKGVGRSMLDALAADGSDAIVAEVEENAVGFFRSCGFAIESAGGTPYKRRYVCTSSAPQ
ncbi:MAG TPA: GNAT family N-acetyltransferase [Gaiellaceae bacterium]